MKGQILYDSTYVMHLEESNSERQTAEWWWPGAGGGERMGRLCLLGTVSVWEDE